MSDHILKTIADLEARIEARTKETERANLKDRGTINDLCGIAGIELKYNVDADSSAVTVNGGGGIATIKPDEFFNKPQATCVRTALNMLRSAGKAPASIEAIYDVLLAGGFDFPTKNREGAIQGLTVSIGKNSALFVKLPSGLIGVKEWYGVPARARGRGAKADDADNQSTEVPTDAESSESAADNSQGQQPAEGGGS